MKKCEICGHDEKDHYDGIEDGQHHLYCNKCKGSKMCFQRLKMSTKSSRYYNEELDLHVYFDHADNKYHLRIGKKSIVVTEGIGEAFRIYDDIINKRICPQCLCPFDEERYVFTGKLEEKT